MTPTRAIARPLLAGIFVSGGIDAIRHPEGKAAKSADVGPQIAAPLGLPTDPVMLVRINGAVQVAGGTLLAIGRFPRLAALALAGSLAPTTYAGHRFWEEEDEASKAQQQAHFLKNVAILGGLILAAADTGGRPSVSWRTRRALKRSRRALKAVHLSHDARHLSHDAGEALSSGAEAIAKVSRKASKQARKKNSKGRRRAGVAMTAAAVATPRAAERAKKVASKKTRDARRHLEHRAHTVTLDRARDLVAESRDLARHAGLPLAG